MSLNVIQTVFKDKTGEMAKGEVLLLNDNSIHAKLMDEEIHMGKGNQECMRQCWVFSGLGGSVIGYFLLGDLHKYDL